MKINYLIVTLSAMILAGCDSSDRSNRYEKPAVRTAIKFTDATKPSGVDFSHFAGRTENKWLPEIMGAGVAVADFNRDGAPDILFANSGTFGEDRPAGAGNKLFINDGRGKFADKTKEWNLTGVGYGQGVAVGDFDNDGWTDVFLTSFEGDNRLLRNTGARFEDVTQAAGLKRDDKWASSAGFADFDADGDLDIFVVKYIEYSKQSHRKTYNNKLPIYTAPYIYTGLSDQLWRNDGGGKFIDVSEASGLTTVKGKGLALAIGDVDKDGDADVYVANDTTPNQLWINNGKGVFEDKAKLVGCAYSEMGREEGSMGADLSDVDNNGFLDIAVTNFQTENTSLYSQKSEMLFREVSDAVGIGEASRVRLKFGIDFFDADNDGDEDLLVANGHIEDNIEKNSDSVTFAQQNTLYESKGDGTFTDISDASGDALVDRQVSRGLAVADFDSDGDLDFVVTSNGGTAQIAFNETAEKGNFVGLWLEGQTANRSAIGTRIVAKVGDRTIERQVMGAQSYLSVSDFRVHIGLGANEKIDELSIYWPGSDVQTLKDVAGGRFYYVRQGQPAAPLVPGEKQIASQ